MDTFCGRTDSNLDVPEPNLNTLIIKSNGSKKEKKEEENIAVYYLRGGVRILDPWKVMLRAKVKLVEGGGKISLRRVSSSSAKFLIDVVMLVFNLL